MTAPISSPVVSRSLLKEIHRFEKEELSFQSALARTREVFFCVQTNLNTQNNEKSIISEHVKHLNGFITNWDRFSKKISISLTQHAANPSYESGYRNLLATIRQFQIVLRINLLGLNQNAIYLSEHPHQSSFLDLGMTKIHVNMAKTHQKLLESIANTNQDLL